MNRRLPLAPSEGWLTVGLMLLLCLTLAWSLDDARLVLGREGYTDFLVWSAVGGVVIGVLGPKVGWGRWRTFIVGAIGAALLTPILAALVLLPDGGSLAELFTATANAAAGAFEDLVVLDQLTTREVGHHLWILGLLVWGTSMFAAYAAFGHRRPLGGIILIGLLLVANISLTVREQLVYLVLFSLAALFLMIRFHTLEEQEDWLRRRIGDPTAISRLYLRGGTIFIVAAVTGSLLLTTVAASDPLAGMWTDMNGRLIELSRGIERYLPASGSGRALGPSFGSTATIRGFWTTNDSPALTVAIAASERDVPYWAAATYDSFELNGWRTSETRSEARESLEGLLAETGDEVDTTGRRELTVTITPAGASSLVFTAHAPTAVDGPVELQLIGDAGYLASVSRSATDAPYTIIAHLPVLGDTIEGGITENRLRVAGSDYPQEIVDLYTALPVNAMGPDATLVLESVLAEARSQAPYDIADAMVGYLRDSNNFTYETDVTRFDCADIGVVECFARFRAGYCEYYASTMAVLLRSIGIPTRLVEGYLPGAPDLGAGVRRVKQSDAHAWVQVYFPGYGWVNFDPTGGGRAALEPIPSGRPEASPTAGPSASLRPARTAPPIGEATTRPNTGGITGTTGGSGGPLIAVTVLLAIAAFAAAFASWRRGPRGPVSADGAYGSVTRLASRFGLGPRPNQTVYEYVGALAEAMPRARPELEMVARAKVEVSYGARVLGDDRLAGLREAQRRLRMSLLGLGLRRMRRRKRS